MSNILRTSTDHKTASLADEGNSAYCQSSGAHNSNVNTFRLDNNDPTQTVFRGRIADLHYVSTTSNT